MSQVDTWTTGQDVPVEKAGAPTTPSVHVTVAVAAGDKGVKSCEQVKMTVAPVDSVAEALAGLVPLAVPPVLTAFATVTVDMSQGGGHDVWLPEKDVVTTPAPFVPAYPDPQVDVAVPSEYVHSNSSVAPGADKADALSWLATVPPVTTALVKDVVDISHVVGQMSPTLLSVVSELQVKV
jgi:hypothetical protein